MMAIVSAVGASKEETIRNLREAITDLEREPANNCIAENFEYELLEHIRELRPMGTWIDMRFLD